MPNGNEEIKAGDLVTLNKDEKWVKTEFSQIGSHYHVWQNKMRDMLGKTYRVKSKFRSKDIDYIIALPSLDGSCNGRWYFPKSVLEKVPRKYKYVK